MEPVDVREHALEAAIMEAAPEPAVLAVVAVAVQNAAVLAWNKALLYISEVVLDLLLILDWPKS